MPQRNTEVIESMHTFLTDKDTLKDLFPKERVFSFFFHQPGFHDGKELVPAHLMGP